MSLMGSRKIILPSPFLNILQTLTVFSISITVFRHFNVCGPDYTHLDLQYIFPIIFFSLIIT